MYICARAFKGLHTILQQPEPSSYLHIWGFKHQVAEWCVAGRWQHRVFYVGQLQTQGSQIIRLRLAAVPFWLEKIPVRPQEQRHHVTELREKQILFTAMINQPLKKWSLILRYVNLTHAKQNTTSIKERAK